MLCPYCIQGFVYKKFTVGTSEADEEIHEIKVPCDECGGMGVIHCCEGLQCSE